MEASVCNLTSPGDKVLVLTAGKFGERWMGLAEGLWLRAGCDQRSLWRDVRSGRGAEGAEAGAQARFLCSRRRPRRARGTMCRRGEAVGTKLRLRLLLVVDGITGLGTTHLRRGRMGVGRSDWRLAEGGDDSAGAGVSQRRETAHGRRWRFRRIRATTLTCARSEDAQKGECLYPFGGADCGLGRGARLYCRAGGRRSGGGAEALIDNAENAAR